ncbi:MAG: transketolase C-terminal domain-containing protein, partial [Armatimonadota bacterium]
VPLDFEAIAASVRKTGRLVVAQEAPVSGGFGAEIVRRVCDECFDALAASPRVVGAPNVPMPFSPALERAVLPGEEQIIAAICRLVA